MLGNHYHILPDVLDLAPTSTNIHIYLNDPKYVNLDLACFMMLNEDLPTLFGGAGHGEVTSLSS